MAQVDFYVLSQPGEAVRQKFACRLAEKAYRLDNTVHILAANREAAMHIDELLWTFRDGSFVPHQVSATSPGSEAPVTIGFDVQVTGKPDLLINLADDLPDSAGDFPRVAEIVSSDEESLRQSRRRFASYRDQGHNLDTHKL